MAKSNQSTTPQKPPSRLSPLPPCSRAIGPRRCRGKLHYFGKVADDPNGQAALDKWLAAEG